MIHILFYKNGRQFLKNQEIFKVRFENHYKENLKSERWTDKYNR